MPICEVLIVGILRLERGLWWGRILESGLILKLPCTFSTRFHKTLDHRRTIWIFCRSPRDKFLPNVVWLLQLKFGIINFTPWYFFHRKKCWQWLQTIRRAVLHLIPEAFICKKERKKWEEKHACFCFIKVNTMKQKLTRFSRIRLVIYRQQTRDDLDSFIFLHPKKSMKLFPVRWSFWPHFPWSKISINLHG